MSYERKIEPLPTESTTMINTDLDISTKVKRDNTTGTIIYNRPRSSDQLVIVEWDDLSISPAYLNELMVKYGGEHWVKVSDLGKRNA